MDYLTLCKHNGIFDRQKIVYLHFEGKGLLFIVERSQHCIYSSRICQARYGAAMKITKGVRQVVLEVEPELGKSLIGFNNLYTEIFIVRRILGKL